MSLEEIEELKDLEDLEERGTGEVTPYIFELLRLHDGYVKVYKALAKLGGERTSKEIAKEVEMSTGSVGNLMGRLGGRGLVRKTGSQPRHYCIREFDDSDALRAMKLSQDAITVYTTLTGEFDEYVDADAKFLAEVLSEKSPLPVDRIAAALNELKEEYMVERVDGAYMAVPLKDVPGYRAEKERAEKRAARQLRRDRSASR